MINLARKEGALLPQGTLRCSSSNGTDQYFVDGNYISKKKLEIVRGIAQREYYEQVIPVLERNLKKLYELEEIYGKRQLETCYEKACNARKKLINPVLESTEQKVMRFMEEDYAPGKFDDENLTEFITFNGERVRSKSEMIIADELSRYKVPYRYEKPIELHDWKGTIVIRPDFTIMNRYNGKVYLYEHLGMMDDMNYVDRNMRKLDLYEKNGYLIGENLIITHETSSLPLNINIVDSYIKHYFL